MTITEYNEIFSYPIVKELTLTFTSQNQGQAPIILTNEDICSEEMSLEEAICSDENLRYGACEASCFKVRVVNSSSFKGMDLHVSMKIKVDDNKYLIDADGNRIVTADGDYIILNVGKKDDYINLGHYKVFSDELSNDRMWRDLVCYDYMYDILNAEMSDWYNFVSDVPGFPMTLKTFRDSFFEWLDITAQIFPDGQVTQTLVNDSFMVNGGFIAEGSLSGKTIIEAICELNGCFGHINRSGKFEYIDLTETTSIAPLWYINDDSGKYEDYTVNHITGIIARSEASDIGTSVGTMANPLIIEGNPLIYGKEGTQALTTALTNILSMVSGLTYRPFKVNTYGNPMLPIGTPITINTKKYDTVNGYQPFAVNSIVSKRVLTGIQGMVDSYEATGTELRGNEANSLQSQIIRTAGKVHDLKVDLDTFESYIRDQNYSTRINQNAQAITLEAQRAQSQEEVAGVMTRYEVDTTDPNDPKIDIYTDIMLTHFADGTRIALWIKGIPNQYSSYRKRIAVTVQLDPQSQIYIYDLSDAYYSGTDYLKDQYKEGVIYHLMYMQNQPFEKEGVSDYYTGWWIGADDSYAKIEVTADQITSYVGNNFVSQSAYDAEIARLQSEIDNQIETFTGSVAPTLNNYPASSWTTDADKDLHIGDLYLVDENGGALAGKYYRFNKTNNVYSWTQLADTDVTRALQEAEEANQRAIAAQQQLDAFVATTQGNFTLVNQTIGAINTTVSGITAREFKSVSFGASPTDYSTDGKIYTITPTLESVDDDTKLSILLQGIPWDGTKKKYIKINNDTMDMGVNTFPIYYTANTQLTNQIGLGNFLNIRFTSNYETATGTYDDVFVVDNNDQTYQRLESELNIERGRTVLRVRSSDGQLVEQSLDATGTASVWTVKAANIQMTASQAMSFLSGGTLTLSGQNGVVINSPNFNVYRDGSVTLTGNITATSGNIGNFYIDSSAGLGYSDNVNHLGMHLHGNELYFTRQNSQGVEQSSTWITSDFVRTNGAVQTPTLTKRGGNWGNSNTSDLDTALKNTLYASYGKGSTTITNAWCFGIVTSSSTQLSLLIPISCIRTDTTISVSDTRISLRTGAGGYVVAADAGIGSASGVVLQNQHMLYVSFTRSSKWTNSNTGNAIPNNSVVIGQISFDITFS